VKVFSVEELGSAVRTRRVELGLTQRDLADFAGCGVRFISELERGKPTVELGKAIALVNALSMDVLVEARPM
jgi:y4mF family transcriptional regulator